MADCDDPAASGAVSHPYPLAGTAPAFGRPLSEREPRASANASHAAHRRHQWGDLSSCGHVDTFHSGRRGGTARSREAGSSFLSPHDVSPRRCRLRSRHHTPCRCPDVGCSVFGRDVCSCRQPRTVALLTVATVAAHPVRCRPAWSEVGTHPTHPTSTRPARKKGAGRQQPSQLQQCRTLAGGRPRLRLPSTCSPKRRRINGGGSGEDRGRQTPGSAWRCAGGGGRAPSAEQLIYNREGGGGGSGVLTVHRLGGAGDTCLSPARRRMGQGRKATGIRGSELLAVQIAYR